MIAQLAFHLPPATDADRDPIRLPLDHPVAMRGSAPAGDGPDNWHGFDAFCTEVQDAQREQAAALWNAIGGAQIKWDPGIGEYTTNTGERYSIDDVYGTVRGLNRG